MKHIGLFGGSFNPVHTGHLILANHIRQVAGLEEVWFVLSPLNPLKDTPEELAPDEFRMAMLELATNPAEGLEPCRVEMCLPRPSYTINTLRYLDREYGENEFSLIIGADSFLNFERWKDFDEIIRLTRHIYVYPRYGYQLPEVSPEGFEFIKAPLIEISSTDIRNKVRAGVDISFLVTDNVNRYIRKHKLYT